MAVSSFVKTEDDVWIIPDYKDSNIKLFNSRGELLSLFGRRGPGPLEFSSPRDCSYQAPYLAVYDFSKQRVVLYRKEGREGFSRIREFVRPFDFIDLRFMGNELLVAGFIAESERSQYCLYSHGIEDGRIRYILPNYVKYGFSSFREYDANKNDKLQIGGAAYCDVDDRFIYFIWEGDLRIIKIDRKTLSRETFGVITKNYRKPAMTNALTAAFNAMNNEGIDAEYQKMSFVNGIFADKDFLGVLYQNYDSREGLWKIFLQLYSLDGRLLKESALSDAVTYVEYHCNNTFYDRTDRSLYYLSITYDKATSLDQYRIIKYRIEP